MFSYAKRKLFLVYNLAELNEYILGFEMSELKVEKHKVVSFTSSILNDKGEVVEQNDIPMEYVHGAGTSDFPDDDMKAMEGAKIGDTIDIILTPENGFGEIDPNKTFRDKIENVPPEFQIIGTEASFQNEKGETLKMKVVSVENGEVFLDGNHPFAGKTMTFRIKVMAIRNATVEEVGSGLVENYQSGDPSKPVVH